MAIQIIKIRAMNLKFKLRFYRIPSSYRSYSSTDAIIDRKGNLKFLRFNRNKLEMMGLLLAKEEKRINMILESRDPYE